MAKTSSYKDLIVWQKSIDLAEIVYSTVKNFPKFEEYGLAQQMRRAAVSISSNIAEGYGRNSRLEYRHFLSIAYGSLLELETQYIIAKRLLYIGGIAPIENLVQEECRILYRMLNPVKHGV